MAKDISTFWNWALSGGALGAVGASYRWLTKSAKLNFRIEDQDSVDQIKALRLVIAEKDEAITLLREEITTLKVRVAMLEAVAKKDSQ